MRGLGKGRRARRVRTLALSCAMIFIRSASMLPSFLSDSITSSGRTTFDDDPIPFLLLLVLHPPKSPTATTRLARGDSLIQGA
jgi:hypothetical protein